MPFFQNPFADDFEGNLVLGDRHHIPKFVVRGNAGRGKEIVVAWNKGTYNLSGNDGDGNSKAILKLSFRLHNTKNWATISVDVTVGAGSVSAVKEHEIAAALNADALFKERFEALVKGYDDLAGPRLQIRQKKPITEFQFYVVNGQAESVLGFNARAGVAELPTYFSRHTIANRFTYPDSQGMLIELNPATVTQAALINNAVDARGVSLNYSSSTVQADWQLLTGRSGLFGFQKGPGTVVASTRTTILYPAGAKVGDLATKVIERLDSGGLIVEKFELPYTLTSGDMITPP